MKNSKQIATHRIIAFIAVSLIPFAVITLGIIMLLGDTIFNISFALCHLIIPVCTIALFAVILFSNTQVWHKILLTILCIIIVSVVFLGIMIVGKFEILSHYTSEEISEYHPVIQSSYEQIPSLSEIGDPEIVEYYEYFSTQIMLFTCESYTLVYKYDDAEYLKQKEMIESSYTFQTETMTSFRSGCSPTTELDGYQIRTLSVDGAYEDLYYPKRMVFIGTNDATNEIVYITFYDDDRDYIESLTTFINEDCGWKHIQ